MTFTKAGSFAAAGGCILLIGIEMCRAVDLPQAVIDRLQNQAPAEKRTVTIVPSSSLQPSSASEGVSAERSQDADKSAEDLIEQVQIMKGTQSGTIKLLRSDKGVNLQFDLGKIRQNFSTLKQVPFGLDATEGASDSAAATAPATVEYRTENARDSVQKIVAIKSNGAVAGDAFSSGVKPVSVQINDADLFAAQIPGSQVHLAVNVKVGDEAHEMNVSDTRRFGNVEVTIVASSNATNSPGHEGLPYLLRVLVIPAE